MAVVSFQGLGEKYEKLFYDEATYGRVREREGRRGKRVQEGEGAWPGRLGERRHWRGRSRERGGHRVVSSEEAWRGRSPGPGDTERQERGRRGQEQGELAWRGRSPGPEWGGRVSGHQGEAEIRAAQWRGRSPGLGDITATGETWV